MPVPVPFLSTDCRLARTMPPMDETLHNSSGSSDEELHCSGDVADQMDSDRGLPDGLAPRRNLHPESSRQLLYDWLEKNLDHPYPLEEKKIEFIQETGMTMKQINYWFINARRRKVPTMREQQYFRELAAARASGHHLPMLGEDSPMTLAHAAYHIRPDHMDLGEQHRFRAAPVLRHAGSRPAVDPLPTTLPSPTTRGLQQISPSVAAATVVAGPCLPMHSPLQVPQATQHQPCHQLNQTHLQHPQPYQLQHQQRYPLQQAQQQVGQQPAQQQVTPAQQSPLLQHSLPGQHGGIWNQQAAAMVKTPTASAATPAGAGSDWGQLSHLTATSTSPPRTLAFGPTSSTSSMASPPRTQHPFTAPSETAGSISPIGTAAAMGTTSANNESNRGPVALSVRMPVFVQARVHPLQQTSPQPAAAAVPVAVQASTYVPWPVRVTPQVTLATSYQTNQLVYTPVSTTPSTLPM